MRLSSHYTTRSDIVSCWRWMRLWGIMSLSFRHGFVYKTNRIASNGDVWCELERWEKRHLGEKSKRSFMRKVTSSSSSSAGSIFTLSPPKRHPDAFVVPSGPPVTRQTYTKRDTSQSSDDRVWLKLMSSEKQMSHHHVGHPSCREHHRPSASWKRKFLADVTDAWNGQWPKGPLPCVALLNGTIRKNKSNYFIVSPVMYVKCRFDYYSPKWTLGN